MNVDSAFGHIDLVCRDVAEALPVSGPYLSRLYLMRIVLALVACAGACASEAICADAPAPGAPLDIKTVIDGLRAREDLMRRGTYNYTIQTQLWLTGTAKISPVPTEDRASQCKEIDWDNMRRVETVTISKKNSGTRDTTRIQTFDGAQFRQFVTSVSDKRKEALVSSNPKNSVEDFAIATTGRPQMFAGDLEKYSDTAKISVVAENNTSLIAARWKSGNSNRVIHLDPGRQFLPVFIESSMDSDAEFRKSTGVLRSYTRYVINKSEMIDGLCLPTEFTMDWLQDMEDGSSRMMVKKTIKVSGFERLSSEPAAEEFRVAFPVGTDVSLIDISAGYVVGGTKEEADEAIANLLKSPPASSSSQPGGSTNPVVQSERPPSSPRVAAKTGTLTHWSWSVAFSVLGLVLLSASWLIIKRRRANEADSAGSTVAHD